MIEVGHNELSEYRLISV